MVGQRSYLGYWENKLPVTNNLSNAAQNAASRMIGDSESGMGNLASSKISSSGGSAQSDGASSIDAQSVHSFYGSSSGNSVCIEA
jgi:hypothetical protein